MYFPFEGDQEQQEMCPMFPGMLTTYTNVIKVASNVDSDLNALFVTKVD